MITREEQYLNRLAGETEQAIPEPETRKEQYLSRLCGADNIIPETPITREEQYLASLCGEEVEMPEPETRLEQYMAFAGGERENKPEPITRKEQLWDKYQGGGVIEDKTVTGEIISVSDAVEAPAVKLKVSIEPKQDLHGYDHPWPAGGGTNQWDEEWEVGYISVVDGHDAPSNNIRTKNYIKVLPETQYYLYTGYTNIVYNPIIFYDENKNFVSAVTQQVWNRTITTPSNAHYMRFYFNAGYGTEYKNDIAVNYPSTATSYEPYSNICPITGWTGAEANVNDETHTTPFNRTVYGGTVDLVSGELSITLGYIASYNGETLTGRWMSSLDVYAEGTTPTTGAEVAYELASPITAQLTPQQIEMLAGNNTVWVDLINEDTTTQIATIELTYKSRAAQRVLAMNSKLNLNKQALELKRNGGVIIDKPIIKPIDKGGVKI